MKPQLLKLPLLICLPFALAQCGDHHDHDHSDHDHAHHEEEGHHHAAEVNAGPNGGHVITSESGLAVEVLVDDQRRARLLRLDAKGQPLALGELTATGVAGERSDPVKLVFVAGAGRDAGVLISDKALPAGAHVPMVLVLKASPDAAPVTERFELHLH